MAAIEAASPDSKTRFLVLTDTYGLEILPRNSLAPICRPGGHDFTLYIPFFKRRVAEARRTIDPTLFQPIIGRYGEARDAEAGITFVDQAICSFQPQNGALLEICAISYTPSFGDWALQYDRYDGYNYAIDNVHDVMMIHGSPIGVMGSNRMGNLIGSLHPFEAVSRARPRLHCYGHIHEVLGVKFIKWRQESATDTFHTTDMHEQNSILIENISTIREKRKRASVELSATRHCIADPYPLKSGSRTLFVNTATSGIRDHPVQPPWVVDLELPRATRQTNFWGTQQSPDYPFCCAGFLIPVRAQCEL
ncbi:hypothetical protein N7457_007001 [Penicillium paradoxum]|uniref:uncharacterized protein n=1 Tax=Penicillium paradoxum TaxID=176176 RepID=UPI00254783E2|nr:uncharacterized protein N7457_007001 [Penicillium paradoxum]KAJ5779281.1 hypothetical protein N7457_007001 [Penicillium paradoxum]